MAACGAWSPFGASSRSAARPGAGTSSARSPWSVEMEPDGTLWATWTESGVCFEPEGCTPTRLGRRDREGWSIVDIPKLYHYSGSHLAVTGDGEAWTCCKHDPQKHGPGLLRFDGRRWHVEQPPTGVDADMLLRMDAADDGTLWLRRSTSALERYRDGAWTVFTEADGVPPLGYTGSELQKLAAAPDGGVWVTPSVSTGHPDDELRSAMASRTSMGRPGPATSVIPASSRWTSHPMGRSGSRPQWSTSRASTRTGSARPWSQSSPTPSGREVASARHPATEQDEQASTSTQRVPRERVRRFAFRAPEPVRGRHCHTLEEGPGLGSRCRVPTTTPSWITTRSTMWRTMACWCSGDVSRMTLPIGSSVEAARSNARGLPDRGNGPGSSLPACAMEPGRRPDQARSLAASAATSTGER